MSAWPCGTVWDSPVTPHHYVHKIARQTERHRIHWCHLYSYFLHISRAIKLGVTLRPIWNIRRTGDIKTTCYGSRGNKFVKYPLFLVLRYTEYTPTPRPSRDPINLNTSQSKNKVSLSYLYSYSK